MTTQYIINMYSLFIIDKKYGESWPIGQGTDNGVYIPYHIPLSVVKVTDFGF